MKLRFLEKIVTGVMLALSMLLSNHAWNNNLSLRAQAVEPAPGSLTHDGLERTYLTYVPEYTAEDEPLPLVLVLHGGGGFGASMRRLTRFQFDRLADEHKFIVVYPDGIDNTWHDGRSLRGGSTADDVGFLAELIETLQAQYPIDSQRVFATGMSNGGFMALRLACDLADQIRGVAPVTALVSEALAADCRPEQSVAMLFIAGANDPLIPYEGGFVGIAGFRRGEVRSAADSFDFWRTFNGCDAEISETTLPNTNRWDGTRIEVMSSTGCASPVDLYTVEGGGHTWPGGLQYLGVRLIGRTTRDLNGGEVIWHFFAALPPER